MAQEIPIEELEKGVQALTWQRGLLSVGVFFVSILIAKTAGHLVRRFYSEDAGVRGPAFAFSKLLTYVLSFAGFVTALWFLGLPPSVLVLMSSALLVGIGFSLQHVSQDVIAGIVILVERSVRKNDFVSFSGTTGTVWEIGLRATQLLTPDGTVLVVPNHLLVTTEVSNQSHPHQRTRLRVQIPVASSEAVDEAAEAIAHAAHHHPEILADPPPTVRLEAIEPWGFRFLLVAWIKDPVAEQRISSQLRFSVSRVFAERGIELPRLPLSAFPSHEPGDPVARP
jgi:small-conductance mechanosensitive channel